MQRIKILFICRGSVKDGLGHLTRSKSLAFEMSKRAQIRLCILGDGCVDKLIENENIYCKILNNEEEILFYFNEFKPDITIFDLLFFETNSFKYIKQNSITVSISPIFDHLSDVDIIFHRSIVYNNDWTQFNQKPLIKAGLKYAVISENCLRIPERSFKKNIKMDTLSIAISMGGTDAANKTLQILHTIRSIRKKVLLWVLLGEGYLHSYQDLVDCIHHSHHEIILAKTNDSMWHIMGKCSMAILAGGTTSYEAAFAGLPTLNILETGDHYFLIQELVEKNAADFLGNSLSESLNIMNNKIDEYISHRERLFKMHQAKRYIDRKGAQRITRDILAFFKKEHVNRIN